MPPITLTSGESTARVSPEHGFNCFAFEAAWDGRTVSVLDSSEEFLATGQRASGNGIPILFPFPNRIAKGRYQWDGKTYELNDGSKHAIHGFALDTPWRVTEQSEASVTAEWQLSRNAPDRRKLWPADCRIEITYALDGPRLNSVIRITNPDDHPLPWGFGTHAYFKLPLVKGSSVEHCIIQAPAHAEWVLSDFIPTGEQKKLSENKPIADGMYVRSAKFDDVLTDVRPAGETVECIIRDEDAGIEVVQAYGREFREIVVYTPPNRDAVCLEPYTCVTDAINLQQRGVDAGWQKLEPGDEVTLNIDIFVRPQTG